MLLVQLLCLVLILKMHLKMWLWKQNILCHFKVLDDSGQWLFKVLCVIDPNDDELSECTHFFGWTRA
jgi:hypothetical protein